MIVFRGNVRHRLKTIIDLYTEYTRDILARNIVAIATYLPTLSQECGTSTLTGELVGLPFKSQQLVLMADPAKTNPSILVVNLKKPRFD